MVKLSAMSGKTSYGLAEFFIDSEEDLDKLPVNVALGSYALTMDNGTLFFLRIVNGAPKWISMEN